MHSKHFRRYPVHPSDLGGGNCRRYLWIPDRVVLLLCGKLYNK